MEPMWIKMYDGWFGNVNEHVVSVTELADGTWQASKWDELTDRYLPVAGAPISDSADKLTTWLVDHLTEVNPLAGFETPSEHDETYVNDAGQRVSRHQATEITLEITDEN